MPDEYEEEVAEASTPSNLSSILDRLRRSTAGREADPGAENSIGRYGVLDEVGRGGMGAIFKVRDEVLRRTLALKVVLNPGRSEDPTVADNLDDARVIRFLEEAQVTGQLEHPGIVPVHELGLDAEGHLFFTMRLVKGRTLEQIFELVKEQTEGWNLTRAVGVLLKVCEAMAYAHEKHVMHRDLKPANIMVGRFGETYVMDWGLAKLLDRKETDADRRELARFTSASLLTSERKEDSGDSMASPFATLDGAVVGTPSYMAPEQAMGRTDEVGPRCDVFSAGAMLYQLLTGQMPYVKPGAKLPPSTVLQWVLDGPPKAIALLAPKAPGELVAICEKAMAREASERYATMLDLANELRAFLEGRVVEAYETGAVAEFRKWIGRNRGFAAAALVAALAVIGGLSWNGWAQAQANTKLSKLNSSLDEASRAADAARDRAVASEAEAVANANAARESAAEAKWQGYAANIAAANASLDLAAASDARRRLQASPVEHRGWEWEHLSLRSNSALLELNGHESIVWTVAFSPDGRFVASGSGNYGDTGGSDYSVRIWNAETGEVVHVLEGHTDRVTSLAFSPSGTELASASLDQTVRLWDVERGVELARGSGTGAVFHPDGDRLLTCSSQSRQVLLWRFYDNTTTVIASFNRGLRSIAVSADGLSLAVGAFDGRVHILNPDTGGVRRTIQASKEVDTLFRDDWMNAATALDFDRTGARLVTGGADGIARVLSVATGEVELTLMGHTGTVTCARFSAEGRWIVTSGLDGTIRFWDAGTGEALEVLLGHDGYVSSLALSPVGDRIVSGSYDKSLRVWDGQPGSVKTLLVGRNNTSFTAYDLSFSPDGTRLAWRPEADAVFVSDARTGEQLLRLPQLGAPAVGMGYTSDGSRLRVIDRGGVVFDCDANTGEFLTEPVELGVNAFGAWLMNDGEQFLLQLSTPASVAIYDFESRRITRTVLEEGINWEATPFDGGRRILIGQGRRVKALDLETGEVLFDVESSGVSTGRPYNVFDIAVHPTERLFVEHNYDSQDYEIRVRDLDTGELVRALRGHAQPSCVAFHPDGARVVTGNWDGTISLWDLERGEIASLKGPTSSVVFDVAFDPTGHRLASTQAGRHVIWETTSPSERAEERRAAAVRRWLEPKAEALIAPLFDRLGTRAEVIAQLEADQAIDQTLKANAVRLARSRAVDPQAVALVARQILVRADRSPDEFSRALRLAEHVQALPQDPEFEVYSVYLLGAARYRMGRYSEAVETLSRALLLPMKTRAFEPDILAFAAMARAKTGDLAEAQKLLSRIPTVNLESYYRTPDFEFDVAFEGVPELMAEANRVVEEAE